MVTRTVPPPPPGATTPRGTAARHPVVLHDLAVVGGDLQLRLADAITRFAGSMPFVYVHVVVFVLWMVVLEEGPWPTLTLVVSLEAIFLSTFVMVGQNRQAEFQRRKADHDFVAQEQELRVNTELTRRVDALVREIHGAVVLAPESWPAPRPPPSIPPPAGAVDP